MATYRLKIQKDGSVKVSTPFGSEVIPDYAAKTTEEKFLKVREVVNTLRDKKASRLAYRADTDSNG